MRAVASAPFLDGYRYLFPSDLYAIGGVVKLSGWNLGVSKEMVRNEVQASQLRFSSASWVACDLQLHVCVLYLYPLIGER